MSFINISHLTFHYEGSPDDVFTDLSFRFDTSWRLGCTGRNGRGKTTLLRLLCGELDSGGAVSLGGARPVYFPFHGFDAGLSVQRLLARFAPGQPEWRVLCELAQLGLDGSVLERPYAVLSSGEQVKVQLACLFASDAAWPLIDEPTNHLDAEGRRSAAEYLSRKDGFFLISHDRAFLDQCADHMLVLGRQKLEVLRGGYSVWETEKQRRDAAEAARNAQLKKEISRLDEAAKRTARWSGQAEQEKFGSHPADRGFLGHKAAKLMKRAKTTEARLEKAAAEKRGLLRDVDEAEPLRLSPLPWGKSAPLLQVRELVLSYDGAPACGPVTFTLRPGERLALAGPNGCGKSTLLRALCRDSAPMDAPCPQILSGELIPGAGLTISFVRQDAEGLRGALRAFAKQNGVDETLFFALLRKLGFERVQFSKDLQELSSGQKKKVLLAASLAAPAHLYVWDEPLNYVDVVSRQQLEQLIAASRASMLFVEHDARFVQAAATRVLRLSPPCR